MKTKKEMKTTAKAVPAKKIPAKRGRPRKQDQILLERTDKVVTKDKGTVLKIFGPSYKVSAILNEAMNEARAAETGLPVAKVLEVLKIRELQRRIGIKPTIRDYVPDEKDFLERLDAMCEQAFDDQCTGANPRYPLMSEIKQMYLNAYYGTHKTV